MVWVCGRADGYWHCWLGMVSQHDRERDGGGEDSHQRREPRYYVQRRRIKREYGVRYTQRRTSSKKERKRRICEENHKGDSGNWEICEEPALGERGKGRRRELVVLIISRLRISAEDSPYAASVRC